MFHSAQQHMLNRIANTRATLSGGLPHWASAESGEWTLTPDGDWTGGAYIGELWLAAHIDPERFAPGDAHDALALMLPRLEFETAFKGFGYYFGAALGAELFNDSRARDIAVRAARSLAEMYDERLGLIPLGKDAEEASSVGDTQSSIDSLQASGLLLWAATELDDQRLDEIAASHLRRVLEIHVRDDGSVVQSSTLDPVTGEAIRTHTHKGYSDSSTWGRAQSWAMLYSSQASVYRPDEPLWRDYARRTTDWWLENVPEDLVAYWDFDDPTIPRASRDTAATAMATAATLRLSHALGGPAGAAYRTFAERTAVNLVKGYLTSASKDDPRPEGMLTGGCFTRRANARAHDAVSDVELIFGSYFLFESLAILTGSLSTGRV